MKHLNHNNFSRAILSLLTVGIMSFGILSIVTMNHDMGMASSRPVIAQTTDCTGPADVQLCVNYHLGIMQNLSTATPTSLGLRLISLLLLSVTAFAILALSKILGYNYIRHRIRFKQLYEKTVTAFALQLGDWLTLLEKRDPSPAFVMA